MFTRVLLPTLLLACSSIVANADDNLVGLPKPNDPKRPGALLLFGGRSITDDAWNRFIELAGGPKARIVIVPSAGFRVSDYDTYEEFEEVLNRRFSAWVGLAKRGRVASVKFLYTDNPAKADRDTFVEPLLTATGVWFSGGQQSRLQYRFVGSYPKQTKFQVALRGVLERGGVVGGTSAGAAALPEIMTLSEDRSLGSCTAVPAHGLGLFNGAVVEQHFNGRSGRLERFTGLLRNEADLAKLQGRPGGSSRLIGLAVDEGTGLVVQGDRLEVLGDSNAHVFLKEGQLKLTWHTLPTRSSAKLKRGRDGEYVLVK
jgi:cyanophycinase